MPTIADDASLAARAAAGDVVACELLIRRHADAVWRVAASSLTDDGAAEQAVLDAFLAAYAALGTFRGDIAVRTWLVSTCLRALGVDQSHHDARAALVSDEPMPGAVRDHLAGCDACVTFARGYERLRRASPRLAPGAPPGLVDLAAAAVASAPAPVVVPLPRRTFGQRALVRVAVGVAASLAVAVAAFALRPGEPSPAVALAAAAERTRDAGSAKVRLDGTTTFVLPVRSALARPDFASLPGELRSRIEDLWRALLSRIRGDAPPSITTTVTLRADGDVAFGDRLRLNGTVGVEGEAAFDLVAGRDGVAVRTEGDQWAVATAKVGPWSAVVGGPDDLVRLLRDATDVTVEAGEYRFRIATPDGTVLTGGAILDDGRLSAVRLSASGSTGGIGGARWTADLRVDLSQPGADVAAEPVEVKDVRDRAPQPDDASRVLYPFGAGVRAALDR